MDWGERWEVSGLVDCNRGWVGLELDIQLGRTALGGVGGIWRRSLLWSSHFVVMLRLQPRPESGLLFVEGLHC